MKKETHKGESWRRGYQVGRKEAVNDIREIIETKLKNDPNNPVLLAGLTYVLVVLKGI